MSQQKRNLFDDNIFKPLAPIGGGKTMRLRMGLWNNNLQFNTKINDNFENMNVGLDQYGILCSWIRDNTDKDSRERNIAMTLRKGRENSQYGMVAFGVGADGIWYVGIANAAGTRVKHSFTPSQKYNTVADGQPVTDAEVSYRLFRTWMANIDKMLPIGWQENYKSPEEMAYKPNGAPGQGGGQRSYPQNNNYPQQGYQQPSAPAAAPLDFDVDIAF